MSLYLHGLIQNASSREWQDQPHISLSSTRPRRRHRRLKPSRLRLHLATGESSRPRRPLRSGGRHRRLLVSASPADFWSFGPAGEPSGIAQHRSTVCRSSSCTAFGRFRGTRAKTCPVERPRSLLRPVPQHSQALVGRSRTACSVPAGTRWRWTSRTSSPCRSNFGCRSWPVKIVVSRRLTARKQPKLASQTLGFCGLCSADPISGSPSTSGPCLPNTVGGFFWPFRGPQCPIRVFEIFRNFRNFAPSHICERQFPKGQRFPNENVAAGYFPKGQRGFRPEKNILVTNLTKFASRLVFGRPSEDLEKFLQIFSKIFKKFFFGKIS